MTRPAPRRIALLAAAATLAGTAVAANADVEPPVLHAKQKRGTAVVADVAPIAPTAKVVDGQTADWTGTAPGVSGFTTYNAGAAVYADFPFDALRAQDGDDPARVARNHAREAAHPGVWRREPTHRADPAGAGGAPA